MKMIAGMDLVGRAVATYEAKLDAIDESDHQDTNPMIEDCQRQINNLIKEMTDEEFRKFIAYTE